MKTPSSLDVSLASPLADRSFHQRSSVATDLLRDVGARADVARFVAEETGDPISGPFVSIGFTNGRHTTVVILHGLTEPAGRLWLSASLALIWHPAVLRTIARVAFGELMAGEVVTSCDPLDDRRIRLFCRLGFRPWLLCDGHFHLRMTYAEARSFYRRAAARHVH